MERILDQNIPSTSSSFHILANDLMHRASEIAAFIGMTRRRTFYLLESRELPATKIGSLWVASKSALRVRLTGGAA
jgi:hypothetical protein